MHLTQIEGTKQERYEALLPQVKAVMSGETDDIANMVNVAAMLREPVWREGEIIAVLDIDSEHLATFDDTDRRYLEELVKLFEDTYGHETHISLHIEPMECAE